MPSYFEVLGVLPQLGRGLVGDDDASADGVRVVVISDRLWGDWFGRRPDVLGQLVRVNALSFTVIGVAPRRFHGTERLGDADLWLPGRTYADVSHVPPALKAKFAAAGGPDYHEFVARLRPGSDFAQADAQLQAAVRRAAQLSPEWTRKFEDVTARVFPDIGLFALGRDQVVRPLRLVMGIVVLVLVIACADVTNLLLVRGAGRRGATAVRIALGASPLRLARLHLAESLVLGRDFVRSEALPDSAPEFPPTVLSLGLARRLFGPADPLGKFVELPQYRAPSLRLQVIGVAGDSRWSDLEREVPLSCTCCRGMRAWWIGRRCWSAHGSPPPT
ncbi:MAG: ABC transporter permease [Gemmatimonadales bacterium]